MYLRLTSLDTNRNEKFQKNISIIHEIISSFEIVCANKEVKEIPVNNSDRTAFFSLIVLINLKLMLLIIIGKQGAKIRKEKDSQ